MPCVVFHKPSPSLPPSLRPLPCPPRDVKLVRVGPVRQVWAGPCTGEVGWVEEGKRRQGKAGEPLPGAVDNQEEEGKHGAVTKHTPTRTWGFSLFLPGCYVSALKWWVKRAAVLARTFWCGLLLVFKHLGVCVEFGRALLLLLLGDAVSCVDPHTTCLNYVQGDINIQLVFVVVVVGVNNK